MRAGRRLAFVFSILLSATASAAGVPLTLSTSGYLLDSNDQPLTQASLSVKFSVWSDPASPLDGTRVWPAVGESECLVAVSNGFYSAVLDGSLSNGCGAGLTSDHLPGGQERYLQLSVGGVVLSPRLRVGTVPTAAFATRSADAQALGAALAASGTINTAGLVDWTQLKSVPAGLADGTDDDTTYTAAPGGGLSLLGTALSIANGGVTNVMLEDAQVTVNAGTGLVGGGAAALGGATTLGLANTTVLPGTYSYASMTVDAQGRITAASNGAAPTGNIGGTGTASFIPKWSAGAALSDSVMYDDGANVGVGTLAPSSKLDVAGTFRASGTSIFLGNVGIGTTNPGAALDVGGTDAIKIPVGTTAQRPASPANGMLRLNTTTGKIEFYNDGWNSLGGMHATGGTVVDVGGYRIHTFTSSGALTVTSGGNVEVLVVAGGGSGGATPSGGYYEAGGGGGGGGLIYNSSYAVTAGQALTVTVGAGGAGATGTVGAGGGNSVFGTLTAVGGGRGGGYYIGPTSGGSGGGGEPWDCSNSKCTGGLGTSGQGNAGGNGLNAVAGNDGAGGGGGAGAVGANGSGANGGNGGAGLAYSISGASVYYAGGGGGAKSPNSGAYGSGGAGGGGNSSHPGNAGTANTGGGGGAGQNGQAASTGGNGGSGIVIVRYPL